MAINSSRYRGEIGARRSSFISNKNKHTYKRTSAANQAAIAKRELLEGINLYGQTYHAARCFPYQPWLPMPEAARHRAALGMTRRSCNSRHDCPVCTSKFMTEKLRDFRRLMDSWVANRGQVFWMTFTLRNSFLEPSRAKYEALSSTWTTMNRRRSFKTLKSKFGVEFVRVLEEVFTEEGWFPHYHVAWFFPHAVTAMQAEEFMASAKIFWAEAANAEWKLGADPSKQFSGPVTQSSSKTFAQYLFKHGFYDVNLDLDTSDLSPFNMARILLQTGEADGWKFWYDFTLASEGMNRVRFSKGLLAILKRG